jgi:hypothetical protein
MWNNPRQRPAGASRAVHEELDLVAVTPVHRHSLGRHALHRRQPLEEAVEHGLEPLLRRSAKLEQLLDRRLRCDRWRLTGPVQAERPPGRDDPRIAALIGRQRAGGIAQPSRQLDISHR